MITWPVCALILGLALIAALWDGLRRFANARGIEARCDKRLADYGEQVETMRKNAEIHLTTSAQRLATIEGALAHRGVRVA